MPPASGRTRPLFGEALWRQPQTITVFAEIAASSAEELGRRLEGAGDSLALESLPHVHFLRLFVIGEDTDLRGRRLPARLVLSAVFDGEAGDFLGDWAAAAGDRLQDLLSTCVGFPKAADTAAAVAWLLARAERPQTFHIGAVRFGMGAIREEERLHAAIRSLVDSRAHRDGSGDPLRLRDEIREFVRSRQDLPQGPRPKEPVLARAFKLLDLLKSICLLLAPPAALALALSPHARCSVAADIAATTVMFVALAAAWLLLIRLHEVVEPDVVVQPDFAKVAALVAREDFVIQNQFTMLTPVRDSLFRRLNLRFVLWLANTLSRHFWNTGKLAGIETIHFARIHQIDEGRRMLFMSEFDGGWERYLYDFLTVGSLAVVPIWTNLRGCPRTIFLRWTTRGFEQRFLPFTRAMQRTTHFWYSAIGHLSLDEIDRNASLRAGLFRHMGPKAAREWLQLI